MFSGVNVFVKLTHGPTVFIEDALQKIMQVIFLAMPQPPSKRWKWTEDKSKVKINSCLVSFSFPELEGRKRITE